MIERILDFIYPPVCELCSERLADGAALCSACADPLPRVKAPLCAKCGEVFDGNLEDRFECPNCRGMNHDFDFARASLRGLSTAFELVHAVKYGRRFYLAKDLAEFLAETLEEESRFQDYAEAVLVPVPLHWRRQQWRHGNQAYELARGLAKVSGHSLADALKRTRSTLTQTKLNRKERLSNLKGAFRVKKEHLGKLKDRRAILIDDVFTTGATAHECARILKTQGGVSEVAILTLVRG